MRLFNRDFLLANMCFMHDVIVASCPLLEFAISRSDGELRDYYRKHLEEERGHDEMLRHDILCELKASDIMHGYQPAQVAGAQYYFIAHHHPAMLLGYMVMLESSALAPSVVTAVENVHGVTLRCLRHHSQHDPGHVKEIEHQISLLPEKLKGNVMWNASCTLQFMVRAMDELWMFVSKAEAA